MADESAPEKMQTDFRLLSEEEKKKKEKELRHKIWLKLQNFEEVDAKRRERRRLCEEIGKYKIDIHEGAEIQNTILKLLEILKEIDILREELLLVKGEEEEAKKPICQRRTLSFEEITELRIEFGGEVKDKIEVEEKTKERKIIEEMFKGRGLPLAAAAEKRQVSNPCLFTPEPWDKRKFVRLTPEMAQKFFKEEQIELPSSKISEISRKEKREKLAEEGRCLDGSYLTPYCMCNGDSRSQPSCVFKASCSPDFAPNLLEHKRQIRQSHGFDIDDYPCSPFGASVVLLEPHENFKGKAESLMEMANLAILEYNEKECNVFKYKVLKIEKVNYLLTAYFHYWITVKVLNLTLGSPIETFQIHARLSTFDDEKVIYCCRPKEEVIVGLPSCDGCFGKLHREEV